MRINYNQNICSKNYSFYKNPKYSFKTNINFFKDPECSFKGKIHFSKIQIIQPKKYSFFLNPEYSFKRNIHFFKIGRIVKGYVERCKRFGKVQRRSNLFFLREQQKLAANFSYSVSLFSDGVNECLVKLSVAYSVSLYSLVTAA